MFSYERADTVNYCKELESPMIDAGTYPVECTAVCHATGGVTQKYQIGVIEPGTAAAAAFSFEEGEPCIPDTSQFVLH